MEKRKEKKERKNAAAWGGRNSLGRGMKEQSGWLDLQFDRDLSYTGCMHLYKIRKFILVICALYCMQILSQKYKT